MFFSEHCVWLMHLQIRKKKINNFINTSIWGICLFFNMVIYSLYMCIYLNLTLVWCHQPHVNGSTHISYVGWHNYAVNQDVPALQIWGNFIQNALSMRRSLLDLFFGLKLLVWLNNKCLHAQFMPFIMAKHEVAGLSVTCRGHLGRYMIFCKISISKLNFPHILIQL